MTDLEAITGATKILQFLSTDLYISSKDLEAVSRTIELASIFPKLKEIADYPCNVQQYCSECQNHNTHIYCASGVAQSALSSITKIEQFLKEKESNKND